MSPTGYTLTDADGNRLTVRLPAAGAQAEPCVRVSAAVSDGSRWISTGVTLSRGQTARLCVILRRWLEDTARGPVADPPAGG
jgi:hypothetical protein